MHVQNKSVGCSDDSLSQLKFPSLGFLPGVHFCLLHVDASQIGLGREG
jgi:hypothetical protein